MQNWQDVIRWAFPKKASDVFWKPGNPPCAKIRGVVQRLEERSSGAGEEVMAAAAAAIANAFFDATGVRMEQYPFTPERVLAALRRGTA